MFLRAVSFAVAVLAAWPTVAQQVRDRDTPLIALPSFDRNRLVGNWYEVVQTPTLLERDCHGTTVEIEEREDSRLTLRISCHVGALDGPVLPIDGIMVETAPAVFVVRFVRLAQLGDLPLVVLWEAGHGDLIALGAPNGQVGWVWARSPHPDPASLDAAKQALMANGYRASAIRDVEHRP